MKPYSKSEGQIDRGIHTADIPKDDNENMEPTGGKDEQD